MLRKIIIIIIIIINSRPPCKSRASILNSLSILASRLFRDCHAPPSIYREKGVLGSTSLQLVDSSLFFFEKMTHIWLLLWPKLISATKCYGESADTAAAKASSTASAAATCSTTHCHGLKRLVRKVKRQRRMLRRWATRPSSGSCKYDPLSYSLNFDSSGWGSFLDGDYYLFHAFSSRFMANPTTVVVASSY